MGTHKQQFQSFIWKFRRQSHVLGLISEERERGLAGFDYLPMTYKIDKRVARRSQQPRFWILWHAVLWPGFERCYKRITEGILCAPHVASMRGKVRHKATVGLASHTFDRPMSATASVLLCVSTHSVTRRR